MVSIRGLVSLIGWRCRDGEESPRGAMMRGVVYLSFVINIDGYVPELNLWLEKVEDSEYSGLL